MMPTTEFINVAVIFDNSHFLIERAKTTFIQKCITGLVWLKHVSSAEIGVLKVELTHSFSTCVQSVKKKKTTVICPLWD